MEKELTDRELLELAAKAAGIEFIYDDINHCGFYSEWMGLSQWNEWNPLTDDGDALRLAVKLRIDLDHYSTAIRCCQSVESLDFSGEPDSWEDFGDNPYTATRRAIVRAAAEIGKTI